MKYLLTIVSHGIFFFYWLHSPGRNMITDPLHGFLVTVQMFEERIIFIFPDSSRRNLGSIVVRYPLGTILYGPKVGRLCWRGCWGSTPGARSRATSRIGNGRAGERSADVHAVCVPCHNEPLPHSHFVCVCVSMISLAFRVDSQLFPGGLNSFHSMVLHSCLKMQTQLTLCLFAF